MAVLWRLLPVTTLTVRQFTGGRTARLAFVLSLIPALFAAIYVARPWEVTPNEFAIDLFRELIVPTLLPIVVLLPATAAFGNELEDGTLPYLLMKPVSRLRLVFGKYAAVLLITIPALLVGLAVTILIAAQAPGAEDLGHILLAMAGASVAAAAPNRPPRPRTQPPPAADGHSPLQIVSPGTGVAGIDELIGRCTVRGPT